VQDLRDGDIAYLHDPQTAGFAPTLKKLGLKVIWPATSASTSRGTRARRLGFMRPYAEVADTLDIYGHLIDAELVPALDLRAEL
jgi:hypothetical protein